MKIIYKVALVLLISIAFGAKKLDIAQNVNNLIATYKGSTDDYQYKFVDDKNTAFLFYDFDNEEEEESEENENSIDLTDNKYIGKKFAITWKIKKIAELDENGEETGKFDEVKSIVSLKEVK